MELGKHYSVYCSIELQHIAIIKNAVRASFCYINFARQEYKIFIMKDVLFKIFYLETNHYCQ